MSSNDIAPEEIPGCTQALLDVLVPEEDLRLYAQIEARIQENEERYTRQIEDARSQLKVLSQTLGQLRATSTRDASNWKSANQHQNDLEKLQAHQFDLEQQNLETESRLQLVEEELEQLRKEIGGLGHVDVDESEGMDKDAIAVGLFRKMGFVPYYAESEKHGTPATFEALMVRSESKNRSVEFDVNDDMMKAKAITPYILANQLWQASE